MEQKTWWKAITYPRAHRLRLASRTTSTSSSRAVEKLLGLEIPPKAVWMRTLLCELNRIHSHLVWLGTSALELGAISMFWYAFREREQILDLFELVAGLPHAHAVLPGRRPRRGHPARLLSRGAQVLRVDAEGGRRVRDAPDAATRSGSSAPKGSACCPPTTRSRSASRARCCAPRASTGTCARSSRTSPTTRSTSDVPVFPEGDVYARYRVHMDGDARVGADHRAVPRPARAHGGRAVDRRRPQGRAAAAPGAPHVDGVADPPLQDRHRGLPRAGGRGLLRDRVAARRARLLRRAPTAARSRGA